MDLKNILPAFCFEGEFLGYEPFGGGHINDTYALTFKRADNPAYRYVVQRVNNKIFPDIAALMHNIISVTKFLAK